MSELKVKLNNGLEMAALTWGQPSKPALVALHGWLDNAHSFLPIAKYLQEYYYVIAPDFIGHGYSSHLPLAANYHFIDMVYHVLEFTQQLSLKSFSLMGHSMGAGIAPLIAACFPEKITQLILLEGIGPLTEVANNSVFRLRNAIRHSQRNKSPKPYPDLETAIQLRINNSVMTYSSAKLIVERGMSQKENDFYWLHDPRLLYPSSSRFTEDQVLNFLAHIHCPTQIVWAEAGIDFFAKVIQERQAHIKNLTVHKIPGGHHAHMDYPEEVFKKIRKC